MSSENRKIRLLFLHPTYTFGGAERALYNLLSGIDRSKYAVTIVTSKKIAVHFSDLSISKIIYIDDMGINVWFKEVKINNLKEYWRDVKKVAGLLRTELPDITVGMMYYASSLLALAKVFFRLKSIIISSPRGPLSPYLKVFLEHKKIDSFFWRANFIFFCKFSDGVIVPVAGIGKDCVDNYYAKKEKVRTIYNGINVEQIKYLSELPLDITFPSDTFIIITSARLAQEKPLAILLKAFAIVRKTIRVKLVIIGDGPDRQELERLSVDLGIQNDVDFMGFQKNPFNFMRCSDLFVHQCLFDGFANVIGEAMACGLPVIASDCPFGPREIITDGENGVLVSMNDVDALAEKISYILGDANMRKKLSENAMKRALEFTVQRMVKNYDDFFDYVCSWKRH